MGIFQRMKQAREQRKIKLEEHKAKKRGESMMAPADEQGEQSETETQPSPTNSVDEQNAPEQPVADQPDPVQQMEPVSQPLALDPAQESEPSSVSTPSSGLLCGCI